MKKYLVLILILLSFFTWSPLFAAEKTSGKNYDNNVKAIDENAYLKWAGVTPEVLLKFTNNGSMTPAEISKMQETLQSVAPNLVIDGKIWPETAKALSLYGQKNTTTNGGEAAVPTSDSNTVIVTEKVPGADCTCIANWAQTQELWKDQAWPVKPGIGESACDNIVYRKYQCTITAGGGLVGFQKIMAEITRVFVYITLLFWVLAIVGLGIGYAIFSGGDEEKTKLIKNYAVNLMIGMMLLFFFRYILVFLAPWIFQ